MIYYHNCNDINDVPLKVVITTAGEKAYSITDLSTATYIEDTEGDEPITLTLESDGLLSPLKTMSATVSIYNEQLLGDLYSSLVHQVDVAIYKDGVLLYYGYLTPNVYNRDWEYIDKIDLEFVSPIATLENYEYPTESVNAKITELSEIFYSIIDKTGFYSQRYLYINKTRAIDSTKLDNNILDDLLINERNFFDDDDEQTPWNCKEVLEQLMTYLGMSLVEWNTDLYMIDYSTNCDEYLKVDLSAHTATTVTLDQTPKVLGFGDYSNGDANISMDETYQKITVNDNLYEIDSIIPDMFSNLTMIGGGYKEAWYTNTNKTSSYDHYIGYYRFYTNDNYNHHAYIVRKHISDTNYLADATVIDGVEEVPFQQFLDWVNFYPAIVAGTMSYVSQDADDAGWVAYCNKWGITIGDYDYENPLHCRKFTGLPYGGGGIFTTDSSGFIPRFSYFANHGIVGLFCKAFEFDNDNRPASYNWKDRFIITLGCTTYANQGTSFYEYGGGIDVLGNQYDSKKITGGENLLKNILPTLKILDTKSNFANYIVSSTGIKKYVSVNGKVTQLPYITPIETQLQYGTSKFSNLSERNVFTVRLSNDSGTTQDCLPTLDKESTDDVSLCADLIQVKQNVTFDMQLTETDGFTTELDDTIFGKSKNIGFALYPSDYTYKYFCDVNNYKHVFSMQGVLVIEDIKFYFAQNTNTDGKDPDEDDDDVIFTNITNDVNPDGSYVGEYDDIELKINTQQTDKPFSYSSVINVNTDGTLTYNTSIYNKALDKSQMEERNLVEEYYNHYATPKIKLESTMWNVYDAYNRVTEGNVGKTLCIDTMEINLRQNQNTITFVEY